MHNLSYSCSIYSHKAVKNFRRRLFHTVKIIIFYIHLECSQLFAGPSGYKKI